MAGSIRERPDRGPGTYELRVFLGRDADGRVRHRSTIFRGTRRAAERALSRLLVEQEDAPAPVPDPVSRSWGLTTTVNDAIAGWKANGWEDLSPVTARRYENLWKVHIRESIGERRIVALSPYDIERYFRDLKARGGSRETVRYVRSVLHRSCRLARKWSGNRLPNPVSDTELPSWGIDEQGEPVRAPTLEELRALLAAAAELDPRYAACLRVIAATGMRRGEACALRWSDVDWVAGSVRVDESIVTANGGAVVKAPKTRASIRSLTLDARTVAELRSLEGVQQDLAEACGEILGPHAFLFSADPGGATPPYPDTVSRAFAKARKKAEVPADVRLHSLRHFQATALDSLLSERQKQARLGWSTVHMARHYTDVIGEEDRRAAAHIGRLLDEQPGGARGTARPTKVDETG